MDDLENYRHTFVESLRMLDCDSKRRACAIEKIWDLYRRDTTVRAFVEGWRRGLFASFEDMLCRLVLQLAAEKQEYVKMAKLEIAFSDPATVIGEERENGRG